MLHILTYATDSIKMPYFNCPIVQNICTNPIWTGQFKDKLHAMTAFLKTKPPSDIVCFLDAYDVICFAKPVEILEKFLGFKTDIVFSAETSCYPWSHVQQLYPITKSLYRFLNSGSYIGYVWALQKILSLDMNQSPCDQGYLTYYYLNHVHDPNAAFKIDLDRQCILFQTAYGIPWSHFIVEDGRLRNTVMRTMPCFIHYNGQQHLMENGESIMPVVYRWIQEKGCVLRHTFEKYKKKHEVICDEKGVPFVDAVKNGENEVKNTVEKENTVEGTRDSEIIHLALTRAKRFVAPNQSLIAARDQVNYHAIIQNNRFISDITEKTTHTEFAKTNRAIIETYLSRIGAKNTMRLDISLHDYVGVQMNNPKWAHSILGFSTDESDIHNILIPDLYAMQNYKGVLEPNVADNLPTLKKTNKLFFIGVSSGKASVEFNSRVAVCRFAQDKSWIDAYISSVVNFTPNAANKFSAYMHPHMSIVEQQTYRHIMVIDGNTACWDRLAWVLTSKCVCWKQESTDQCWYYSFLEPWVHYVPFTLDTLEETWVKVRDDHTLQLRIVAAANQFVEDFLKPRCHALYMRTLLEGIQAVYDSKPNK